MSSEQKALVRFERGEALVLIRGSLSDSCNSSLPRKEFGSDRRRRRSFSCCHRPGESPG
jgi:hypothetical protein